MHPGSWRQRHLLNLAAADLSPPALEVLTYVMRQRLRMQQSIALAELRRQLPLDPAALTFALDECADAGWLLIAEDPADPAYSIPEFAPRAGQRISSAVPS